MLKIWPAKPQRRVKRPEYATWYRMWKRTTDDSNPRWVKYYKDAGITVCERWRSFDNFYDDMGPRPSLNHSLERIDRLKGYSPDNCKWATHREQMWNRSITRWISFNGETLPLSEWARRLNISTSGLFNRLKVMSVEDALTKQKRNYSYKSRKKHA